MKPEAFVELDKIVLQNFYESQEAEHWNGYRLIGVDGSTVELPNSIEIQQNYGVFKRRKDGKAICMGRTLMMYDTINTSRLP